MKRLINYSIMVLLLGFFSAAIPPTKVSGQEVSFQIFYDQLSPYGHWVEFPDEGYVWIPAEQSGFSPYQSGGYWAYTDYGWTWVSDYSWGWAPFHYGRWDFDDNYGWYWVPDYEWAPAWVVWSREPGYYGWAPLRPGIEVNEAITSGYYAHPDHWSYVHEEYLGRRDMDRHFAPRSENNNHIRNSQMINQTFMDQERHTTYAGGPPREEVQKATGASVQQLTVVPRSKPGQTVAANQVSIYKPVVVQKTTEAPPPKLESIKDVKPLPGRSPNLERLKVAPQSPQTPQTMQRSTPVNTATPPTKQPDRTITQAPPERITPPPNERQPAPQIQNGQPMPPQRQQPPAQTQQQPPPQQNAPRENPQTQQPRQQQQPQVQQTAPRQAQQQAMPKYQRENRYAPPAYQAPKPQAPQHEQRPSAPPMQQQRAEQPHAGQPQQQRTPPAQGQPRQDGKPK